MITPTTGSTVQFALRFVDSVMQRILLQSACECRKEETKARAARLQKMNAQHPLQANKQTNK